MLKLKHPEGKLADLKKGKTRHTGTKEEKAAGNEWLHNHKEKDSGDVEICEICENWKMEI